MNNTCDLTSFCQKSHVSVARMSSFIPRDLPDFAAVDVLSGIAVMDIATELQNYKLDGENNFV